MSCSGLSIHWRFPAFLESECSMVSDSLQLTVSPALVESNDEPLRDIPIQRKLYLCLSAFSERGQFILQELVGERT